MVFLLGRWELCKAVSPWQYICVLPSYGRYRKHEYILVNLAENEPSEDVIFRFDYDVLPFFYWSVGGL